MKIAAACPIHHAMAVELLAPACHQAGSGRFTSYDKSDRVGIGMAQDHFNIGIIVARRKLASPWASHAWIPTAALPAVPEAEPGTPLSRNGADETFYAGDAEVTLYSSATGHYRDNLSAAAPSLWVVLRPVGEEIELVSVTADPYEGEALAGSIGDIVEAVPMPLEIQARVHAFVEAFHVERTFFKRKRDRADPEALANRQPGVKHRKSRDQEDEG
jgi:uncharacterized protein DUF3305